MKNYIRNHWEGNHSLAHSYWINGVFISILYNLAVMFITQNFISDVSHPVTDGRIVIAMLTFGTILAIWQLVGIWRSCRRRIQDPTESNFWATLVQALIILAVIGNGVEYSQMWPDIKSNFEIGVLPDELSDWQVEVNENLLRITGHIGWGLAEKVQQTLNINPQVDIIELNSGGGWIREGRELATVIQSYSLPIVVTEGCYSACTIAFIAGDKRYVLEDAVISFHRYTSFVDESLNTNSIDAIDYVFFKNQGIKKEFLVEVDNQLKSDEWFTPGNMTLFYGGVIHLVFDSNYDPVFSSIEEANEYFFNKTESVN